MITQEDLIIILPVLGVVLMMYFFHAKGYTIKTFIKTVEGIFAMGKNGNNN
jgi:hypothetical protein